MGVTNSNSNDNSNSNATTTTTTNDNNTSINDNDNHDNDNDNNNTNVAIQEGLTIGERVHGRMSTGTVPTGVAQPLKSPMKLRGISLCRPPQSDRCCNPGGADP